LKTSQAGTKFYSGVLNLKGAGFHDKDIPVVVFKNKNKREGKQDADLDIYLSQPKEGAAKPAAPKAAAKPAPAPTPPPTPPVPADDDVL